MKKYIYLTIGIVIILFLSRNTISAQSASFWYMRTLDGVKNVMPVVSSWRVRAPNGFTGSTMTVSELKSCDTIDTDADGVFSCGADNAGAGANQINIEEGGVAVADNSSAALTFNFDGDDFGTSDSSNTVTITSNAGISQTDGDARYINQSGDTMTGSLAVQGNMSGYTLYSQTQSGAGLTECNSTTEKQLWNATAETWSCGTDLDTTYTAGEGIQLTGATFSRISTLTGTTLNVTGNISGSGTLSIENNSSLQGDLSVGGTATLVGVTISSTLTITGNATFAADVEIAGTGSGDHLHAHRLLTASGTVSIDGMIYAQGGVTGDLTGNADTATALASNGANCAAGSYPLGVDASGAVESCTDATTEIDSAIATHAGDGAAHHALVTLAGQDYLTLSTQQITAGKIEPDDLASSDFGDFTCNGTTCSLDTDYITEEELSDESELETQLTDVTNVLTNNDSITFTATGSWIQGYDYSTDMSVNTTGTQPIHAGYDGVFEKFEGNAATAPTGSSLIFDVEECDADCSSNCASIFSTRPEIDAGANEDDSNYVISDTTLEEGQCYMFYIDQVGSTIAGSGATLQTFFTRTLTVQ